MPLPGMPIGNRQIPLPINPASPMPALSKNTSAHPAAGNSARMRYQPWDTITGNEGQSRSRTAQAAIQRRYTTKGPSAKASREAARMLLELEHLQQRLESYNRNSVDADLAQYGSRSRLPPNHSALAFTGAQLFKLPCTLRDASRNLERTITKLRNGEETHPIECNFDDTKQLLNTLADLKSILRPRPQIQGKKVK